MESENDSRLDGLQFENGYTDVPGGKLRTQCNQCGSTIPADSLFCYMCGGTVEAGEGSSGRSLNEEWYPTFLEAPISARFRAAQSSAETSPKSEIPAGSYYPPRPHVPIPVEEYEKKDEKKINVRHVLAYFLLAVVFGSIVALAWKDRSGLFDFASFLKRSVSDVFEEPKRPKEESVTVVVPAARPRSRVRQFRPAVMTRVETVREPPLVATADFMPVRVDGQPSSPHVLFNGLRMLTASDAGLFGAALRLTSDRYTSPLQIEISPRESLSMLLKQVPPVYPRAAREAHLQGSVVLKAVIGKDGLVKSLHPVSGNPVLTAAAVNAVKQWMYRPYYRDGEPQQVQTLVVVEFSLVDSSSVIEER
ncbi:MAG: TonB family protein [Terriglobales bacterium]